MRVFDYSKLQSIDDLKVYLDEWIEDVFETDDEYLNTLFDLCYSFYTGMWVNQRELMLDFKDRPYFLPKFQENLDILTNRKEEFKTMIPHYTMKSMVEDSIIKYLSSLYKVDKDIVEDLYYNMYKDDDFDEKIEEIKDYLNTNY